MTWSTFHEHPQFLSDLWTYYLTLSAWCKWIYTVVRKESTITAILKTSGAIVQNLCCQVISNSRFVHPCCKQLCIQCLTQWIMNWQSRGGDSHGLIWSSIPACLECLSKPPVALWTRYEYRTSWIRWSAIISQPRLQVTFVNTTAWCTTDCNYSSMVYGALPVLCLSGW